MPRGPVPASKLVTIFDHVQEAADLEAGKSRRAANKGTNRTMRCETEPAGLAKAKAEAALAREELEKAKAELAAQPELASVKQELVKQKSEVAMLKKRAAGAAEASAESEKLAAHAFSHMVQDMMVAQTGVDRADLPLRAGENRRPPQSASQLVTIVKNRVDELNRLAGAESTDTSTASGHDFQIQSAGLRRAIPEEHLQPLDISLSDDPLEFPHDGLAAAAIEGEYEVSWGELPGEEDAWVQYKCANEGLWWSNTKTGEFFLEANQTSGWTSYKWNNADTHTVSTWWCRVDDDEQIICGKWFYARTGNKTP